VTGPSNEALGQLLGVSHAAISRYKSGDRFPDLDVLARIAELADWSMDDQYRARQNGTYSDEFGRRLARVALERGTVEQDAASDQQGGSRQTSSDSPSS
jgi:transcriptional regulator with XRE-family HTH domain